MLKKQESKLQRDTRRLIEMVLGGFWFKVHGGPFQRAGIPDLLGCVMGYYIGVELKWGERGKTSGVQKEVMRLIRREGGMAFVSRDPHHAVDKIIKGLRTRNALTKNEALSLSKKSHSICLKRKKRRLVYGTGDWEDARRTRGRRKAVVSGLR